MFAIDNLDSAINPRLVTRLVGHLAAWLAARLLEFFLKGVVEEFVPMLAQKDDELFLLFPASFSRRVSVRPTAPEIAPRGRRPRGKREG